jgi:1,4-dihydroxy-2-naphthoyl-CoA hydrolase
VATPPTTPAEPPDSGRLSVHDHLAIEILEAGPDRVVMRLPVDWRVHQPHGILHGGVSALLAESAASYAASLAAGPRRHVVGIELNASHLRAVRDGHLTAEATPVRVGRSVQVWRVALHDDNGRAVCEARCTLAVLEGDATPEGSPAQR